MAVRKLIVIGDPKLKRKNKEILDFKSARFKKLIRDLVDTMRDSDLVGIAAPQIGENYQVFVTEQRKTKARRRIQNDKLRIFVNPKCLALSRSHSIIYEGCGCTGDLFGPVKRPKSVKVKAQNEIGESFLFETDGLLGRIIQHELDHLDGFEFVQRVVNNGDFVHRNYYLRHIRNSDTQARNSKITKMKYTKL